MEALILLYERKVSFICSVDNRTDSQTGQGNQRVVNNLRKFLFQIRAVLEYTSQDMSSFFPNQQKSE